MASIIVQRIELPVESVPASSERDLAGVLTGSEREDQARIAAASVHTSSRHNKFHESE